MPDQLSKLFDFSKPESALKTVAWAGLLAGALDIMAAFISSYISSETDPIIVLQYIASGFFGKQAFTGGTEMAMWGLAFHFIITFSWALLLFVIYPRVIGALNSRLITGLLYGIFIWFMMNVIILPLTNVSQAPLTIAGSLLGILILMLFVGLPIALVVDKYYSVADKAGNLEGGIMNDE